MIHAYQEIYLNKAQAVLGDSFDYAIDTCKISGDDFIKMFLASPISKKIENGEHKYLIGKSGVEIVNEIVFETTGKEIENEPDEHFGRSKEYWIGWAVAYYQWFSCRSYSEIFEAVSFNDLQNMYYTFHEADISKFVDIVDEKVKECFPNTNLKRLRTMCGYSQSMLAKKAGVSLRSIQMYEQRNKDINKASVDTLYRISKVIGCTIEDLIEK